jgi:hypothetical protein
MGTEGAPSPSVKEASAPGGEKTRSIDGCDRVCFLGMRAPCGSCPCSLGNTALAARAGSACCGGLLGDAPA